MKAVPKGSCQRLTALNQATKRRVTRHRREVTASAVRERVASISRNSGQLQLLLVHRLEPRCKQLQPAAHVYCQVMLTWHHSMPPQQGHWPSTSLQGHQQCRNNSRWTNY